MAASPLILVVGMHRSGTSLLGSLLHHAGVALPGPLISGDQHNPEGYFERADITALQEQLLIDLERWWPSAHGIHPLPVNWLCRARTHAVLDQLRGLVADEQQRQSGPWAIKDPRTSLLLPLWRRLTGELQIPLRIILAVRHPAEVVHSLGQRDAAAAGMTPQRAELLWWHHNQTVLRHSHGLPLTAVDYGQWFAETEAPAEQLSRLRQFCGLPSADDWFDQRQACLSLIKPEHRHSKGTSTQVTLESDTLALYRNLVAGDFTAASRAQRPYRVHLPLIADPPRRPIRQRQATPTPALDLASLQGWFDSAYYQRRYSDLADLANPLEHYIGHGWREGRQPHPLFDPGHYLQRCLQLGLVPPADQPPLQHFVHQGLAAGIVPTPLLHTGWWEHRRGALRAEQAPTLVELHPWGGTAMALADHDQAAAAALLQHWIHHGIPAVDWPSIERAASPWLRWPRNPPVAAQVDGHGSPGLPLSTSGLPLSHWISQGWLASLPTPVPPLQQSQTWQRLHLVLLPPGQLPPVAEMTALSQAPGLVVADPDPQRCQIWRHLGVACLPLAAPTGNQLDGHLAADPWLQRAETQLGLPAPAALASRPLLTLGSGGTHWDSQNDHPDRWCCPGFDALLLEEPEAGRSLASWLWHCHRQGLTLVRLSGDANEQAMVQTLCWLPMQWICVDGLTPSSLHWELAWRQSGRPAPAAPITPQPEVTVVWDGGHRRGSDNAQIAVVVSLYNYAERIAEALDSVAAQHLPLLELIVVDDASHDAGLAIVQTWLDQNSQRFQRALLLQHAENAGLAAARNTGFGAARAPWCLVLDADNALLPQAAAELLKIAQQGSDQLAVVHPLIEQQLEQVDGQRHSTGLLNTLSWQAALFRRRNEGNYIDAMALVRRTAWQAVGGYVNIPGGWEDFDFWCLLIEAGFHGVLCPAVLAQYRCHTGSMLHQNTNANVRRISRLLQHRHSWLQLRLGQAAF